MNFLYCFQSEWLKKRRSLASWIVVLGAFFTPAIVTLAKLVKSERLGAESVSTNFWDSLWTSSWESMAILILPWGLILATSLAAQIEYRNNSWKQVLTVPQSETNIYFAKLAVIVVMVVQLFILFNAGIYLSGVIPGLLRGVPYPQETIPYLVFLKEDARYFADALPILALEFLVSLRFSNFLVPVGGGAVLWIMSLALLSGKYAFVFPYTYIGLHYMQAAGRYRQNMPIHLFAIGYFFLFIAAGYVLFLTKKQKG